MVCVGRVPSVRANTCSSFSAGPLVANEPGSLSNSLTRGRVICS